MSLSSRRSSSAPGKRSSCQGAPSGGTPDKRSNPTVLARKKRIMVQQREKVTLEWVLGLTCVNGNGLAVSGEAKCIAYPAGCVVVLYHPKPNRQTHLINPARKTISCVAFSPGGKYLAAGECGHQPCIRVWDVASQTILSELQGHTFGVACVAFSPNTKHLVSVGYQHDMLVNLWSWKTSAKIAGNKVSNKVFGIDFSEDGSYFVTVGHRLVKYWYFKTQDKMRHAQPLQGRSAVLGEHLRESFMGVRCGKGGTASNTYCVTKSGKLCMFDEKRSLDQFIELKVAGANCLAISEQFVFCGCVNGTVRLFDPYTLEYMTTLPKPHHLGVRIGGFDLGEDVAAEKGEGKEGKSSVGAEEAVKEYPDVVAVGIDTEQNRLSCVYNDHSLYTWDLRHIRHIGKLHSFLYHSAAIWDIDVYPDQSGGHHLPPNCFATCSTDGSVRFWSLDSSLPPQWKNVYSKELLKVIYTDQDVTWLKDQTRVPGSVSAAMDTSKGIRTLKFRPNGEHLALGDRTGNLQVYDLQFMDKLREVVAHDSEILCVEFSNPELGHELMATASRDRLIHVFDAKDDYQFLQTLDEHSAAITSVKFASGKDDNFQLISCGADKSIIFRSLDKPAGSSPNFQLSSHIAGKATLFDMVTDVTGKFLATAGQDRNLTIFHIASGKKKLAYKAAGSDEGTLIRASLDPSGCFVATSSSDKSLCIFDFYSGDNIAKLYGHSEVITGIKFSSDLRRVYSVSGDGCIFAWRLSNELSQAMCSRLVELGREAPMLSSEPLRPSHTRRETYNVSPNSEDTKEGSQDETDFRFSVSQLPPWAQKQMLSRPSVACKVESGGGRVPPPSVSSPARVYGKWAERVADMGDVSRIKLAYGSPVDEVLSPSDLEGPSAVSLLAVEGVESRVGGVDVVEAGESDSDGEEGGEEEVVYPAEGKTVDEDAELFQVTSPVKVTLPEPTPDTSEKEETSPNEPLDSSPMFPEGLNLEVEEQELFMKANFESLSAADADKFFGTTHSLADANCSRLSISTQFLSKSLDRRRLMGRPQEPHSVTTFSAPQPRQGTTAATVLSDDSASPLLSQPPKMLPVSGASAEVVKLCSGAAAGPEVPLEPERLEEKALCVEGASSDEASLLPSQKSMQKSTVSEEVDKAKRRLQELGWSLSSRGDGSKKVIAVLPSSGTKASQEWPDREEGPLLGRNTDEVAMTTLGEVVDVVSGEIGCDKEQTAATVTDERTATAVKEEEDEAAVKEEENEAAAREGDIGAVVREGLEEGDTAETPMPLLGQTRRLVQDLTLTFQALVAQHIAVLEMAEAEGETEDTECSIVLMSQALTSVKEQSSSLAAKHRRRWKWSRQKATRETLLRHLGEDSIQPAANLDTSGIISAGHTPMRLATPQRGAANREACGDGGLAQPESLQLVDNTVAGNLHGSSRTMSDPAVVELLKHYSEQLLTSIREQMHSK